MVAKHHRRVRQGSPIMQAASKRALVNDKERSPKSTITVRPTRASLCACSMDQCKARESSTDHNQPWWALTKAIAAT